MTSVTFLHFHDDLTIQYAKNTQKENTLSGFLTVNDIAARWSTTPAAVRMLRHRGDAPRATRIGRKLLFALADVEQFEADRREDAA